MSKPIFLVNIPDKDVNQERFDFLNKVLSKKLDDYHVVLIVSNREEPHFQCFNSSDADEIAFEDLKTMVKESLRP